MNSLKAAQETLELARRGTARNSTLPAELNLPHLHDMLERMETTEQSEGKINRWLGWIQAAVVANGLLTLEDCKQINMRNTGASQ